MENIQSKLYFPSQVVSGDIENFAAQGHKLVNWIYDYRDRHPRSANISNEGGWQSHDKWFYETEPTFDPWMLLFKQELRELLEYYRFEHQNIELTSMWINIGSKNSYNVTHTHKPTHLSGVWWIKIPKNCGRFVFTYPDGCYSDIALINSTRMDYREEISLHPGIVEYPREGKIMLFPAAMPHRVELNQSDEDRISISFNLMINT